MNTLPVPITRDRNTAAAMHVATIFFPLVAPVVALAIGHASPFVRAHAIRSLKETIVVQAIVFVGAVVSFTHSAISLYHHYQEDWKNFSVVPIILKFVVVWLILGLLELWNAIAAIRAAHLATKGEWPKGAQAVASASRR